MYRDITPQQKRTFDDYPQTTVLVIGLVGLGILLLLMKLPSLTDWLAW